MVKEEKFVRLLFRVSEIKQGERNVFGLPKKNTPLFVLETHPHHVAFGNHRRSLLGVPKTAPLGGVVVSDLDVVSRDEEDWFCGALVDALFCAAR